MKIASLACAWPPYAGGIGNSAQQISELLREKHEVEDFYPAKIKPVLHYGHGSFSPSLFFKLRHFDYIYLHYPYFGTAEVVWFFKLFFKKPKLIIHYHMDVKNLDPIARVLSWPSRLILKSLLSQAETIVSASLDYVGASQIKKYYNEHQQKFVEIPFGVDIDKFQPKDLKRPAQNRIIAKTQELVNFINEKFIKKNRLEFLFVGGLDQAHYFKGIKELITALNLLRREDWRLNIVGEGDLRATYEKTVTDLGLEGRIKFSGKLADSELIRAYQNSDLLILPSVNSNEAFGIVLIEALACGVPVLASDLPGVRRVFENYKEGLLAAAGNVEDLKKKLEFIIRNKELRRLMSLAARRLAEKKYDLKLMSKKLEGLFEIK